jgi:peroxiredoxin
MSNLPPDREAPDFVLTAAHGNRVALRDYRGSPVVLISCPADWSLVCGIQGTRRC